MIEDGVVCSNCHDAKKLPSYKRKAYHIHVNLNQICFMLNCILQTKKTFLILTDSWMGEIDLFFDKMSDI